MRSAGAFEEVGVLVLELKVLEDCETGVPKLEGVPGAVLVDLVEEAIVLTDGARGDEPELAAQPPCFI